MAHRRSGPRPTSPPASTACSAGSTARTRRCCSTEPRSADSTSTTARAASSAPPSARLARSRWCAMATDLARAQLLTGGEAIVEAMRQIDPDVVPVYPITPQTPIIQGYAKALADGRAHGEMINVESEHSAMSAAIAAAVAGARTMTATSSQGLALMAEVVYIAASMRAPVVMALGNRALSGPINIHCDHSDSMLIRDSGAIQLFAESAQEAYDLTVLAPRLAEHPDVLLPVIVCVDGFTITHSAEPVAAARRRAGARLRRRVPNPAPAPRPCRPDHPGPVRDAGLLLRAAPPAGGRDRGLARRLRGARPPSCRRAHRPQLRRRRARTGSRTPSARSSASARPPAPQRTSSTSCATRVRRSGCSGSAPTGRSPPPRCRAALADVDEIVVLDRADSPGGAPPLAVEVAYAVGPVHSHVYGLGGRDLHPADLRTVFAGTASQYVGLRSVTTCHA